MFLAAALLIGLGCESGAGRDSSLHSGPEAAPRYQDPGAKTIRDEVDSLPFKHIEWEYRLTNRKIRRMTLEGEHLFVETPDHEVVALDRRAGVVKWIYKVDTRTPLDFPPVVAEGVPEKIRQMEEELLDVNRRIQDRVKEKAIGEEVTRLQEERSKKREAIKVSRFGDNVYFLSRHVLYCLDRQSGYLRWTRRLDFIPSAQPFATQYFVFVSAADLARVYALSVTDRGATVGFFRADLGDPENHVTTRPLFEDPTLYFASHDGKVYSFTVRDRRRRTPFRTLRAIRADPILHVSRRGGTANGKEKERPRKTLFVGSTDNAFYAIDGESGELNWRYECGAPIRSAAVAKDSTVYVKSAGGALFALEVAPMHTAREDGVDGPKRDGRLRWKLPLGERFLVKGSRSVYVLGHRNEIYAMNEYTGDIVGRYPTRQLEILLTNPADDILYCANSAGYIYALREAKERY